MIRGDYTFKNEKKECSSQTNRNIGGPALKELQIIAFIPPSVLRDQPLNEIHGNRELDTGKSVIGGAFSLLSPRSAGKAFNIELSISRSSNLRRSRQGSQSGLNVRDLFLSPVSAADSYPSKERPFLFFLYYPIL